MRGDIITDPKYYSNGYYKVYVHTNLMNGKRYVGITSQKPEYRWNYGNAYKNNPHFWSAICKYGWDGFSHEILFDYLDKEQAEAKEIELIAKWNTQDRRFGYNVAAGGESNSGYVPTEEVRRKWSEARTGTKRSAETKARMAEASRRNYERCREPLAKAKYKPVNMYTLDGEFIRSFESIMAAGAEFGWPHSTYAHIGEVCKGKRKQCGGYYWEYAK